jgi:hypothetical protein
MYAPNAKATDLLLMVNPARGALLPQRLNLK